MADENLPARYFPQAWAVLSVVFEWADSESPQLIVAPLRDYTITLNDYRNADTWSIELPFRAFPWDEGVRSLAAELYLFDAGGFAGDPDPFLTEDALEVSGLAINVDADRAGNTTRIDGEDYTGLLSSKTWSPADRTIPVGRPLDSTVQDLVNEAVNAVKHGGSTLTVVFQADSEMTTAPIVGQGMTKSYARGMPVITGSSFWDAIYYLCLRHGCICFVRGNDVVIAAPATISDDRLEASRRFIYGRNLSELSIRRDIGHKPAPAILATSYDPVRREVLEATWPPSTQIQKPARRPKGQPAPPKQLKPRAFAGKQKRPLLHGTGHAKDEIRRVLAPPGITTLKALQDYARAYHAQVSRAEATIHLGTRHLVDADRKTLLGRKGLRTGTACFLEWDEYRADDLRQLDEQARADRLIAMGHPSDVAWIMARNLEAARSVNRPFYARSVVKSGSVDDGLTIEVEAVNFVDPGEHGEGGTDQGDRAEAAGTPTPPATDGAEVLRDALQELQKIQGGT